MSACLQQVQGATVTAAMQHISMTRPPGDVKVQSVSAICRLDGRISACSSDKQTCEVQLGEHGVKSYKLAELLHLEHRQMLQWVSPAETISQSLTGMLKYAF